jgi:hypothetical protein
MVNTLARWQLQADFTTLPTGYTFQITKVSDLYATDITIADTLVADNYVFSPNQVRNALNLPVSGGTIGGLLTLGSDGISAEWTYTPNQQQYVT